MKKVKVLVFPCGSECGLEIGRSLRNLKEIDLYGASSVDDHGRFVYDKYIGGLPFINETNFIDALNEVLSEHSIDFIYPAMDSVIATLTSSSKLLASVVGSSEKTANIALSKKKTYDTLSGVVRCPILYDLVALEKANMPLFLKPDIGYGSRGTRLARSIKEIKVLVDADPSLLILEYLPGEEYTVDCFTDFRGKLKFYGARARRRISRGISVNTVNVEDRDGAFGKIANAINDVIRFNGAWFFQVKRARDGDLALLEVAPRIAGSMGLHRCKGVNLPLLSIFNQMKIDVDVLENDYAIEYDRALYNKVSISVDFDTIYFDFDDCILLDRSILNADAIKLIVECRNKGIRVILISRHDGDLKNTLDELGLIKLFDEVYHLTGNEMKSSYMKYREAIMIDDSYNERLDAANIGIPSLGPESIETLLS